MATHSKYRAVITKVDGIKFRSKAEADRYSELKILERANEITCLKLQPKYNLDGRQGFHVCNYIGDFQYYDKDGSCICEDVKGIETELFKLKWKLVHQEYANINFVMIKKGRGINIDKRGRNNE